MNFFEYLFCRLYWWNTEVIKERSTPVFRSIVGLAVFHGFSAIPIFGVLYVLIYNSYYIDKTFLGMSPFLIIVIIAMIINFLYFRKKQRVLYKQFKNIPKQEKKRKDVLCIIYIVSIIEYITPNVPLVSLTNVPDISLLNVPLFTGCN